MKIFIGQINPTVGALSSNAELIRRAYEYAAEAHKDQRRASGGPYMEHPANTAYLLAQLGMDPVAIAAGLLHDVPEDTPFSLDDVRTNFGDEVARLVDGVTKLSRFSGVGAEAQQAENIRKMFLAMADDLRVVVIKLADRLHNMRTLHPLPPEKQQRIARQTLEIYAPLAHRLGIWQVKWELEDLAFKYVEPERYRELADRLASKRQEREKRIKDAMELLFKELEKAGIRAELSGRAKHIYSIYRKMSRKTVDLDEIYDLLAVRVVVDEVPEWGERVAGLPSLPAPPEPWLYDGRIRLQVLSEALDL
jgi:GTP pyrophosphokinase